MMNVLRVRFSSWQIPAIIPAVIPAIHGSLPDLVPPSASKASLMAHQNINFAPFWGEIKLLIYIKDYLNLAGHQFGASLSYRCKSFMRVLARALLR